MAEATIETGSLKLGAKGGFLGPTISDVGNRDFDYFRLPTL